MNFDWIYCWFFFLLNLVLFFIIIYSDLIRIFVFIGIIIILFPLFIFYKMNFLGILIVLIIAGGQAILFLFTLTFLNFKESDTFIKKKQSADTLNHPNSYLPIYEFLFYFFILVFFYLILTFDNFLYLAWIPKNDLINLDNILFLKDDIYLFLLQNPLSILAESFYLNFSRTFLIMILLIFVTLIGVLHLLKPLKSQKSINI